MNIKVRVSPEFKYLKGYLESLPTTFNNNGKTLKDDRNEIKVIEYDNLKLCIKSFKKATVFNKYMYSWFRATKAKRSYEVARRFEKLGINTPKPVAYVEEYGKWHILKGAYYVSFYLEYDFEIRDVFNKNIKCQEKILSSFAREMASVVHPFGAWHNDLSPGNVLINEVDEDEWKFSFIDLNRVTFRSYIFPSQWLVNIKRLTNDPVAIAIMAESYANEVGKSPRLYSVLLQRYNLRSFIFRFFTKKVLGVFKFRRIRMLLNK